MHLQQQEKSILRCPVRAVYIATSNRALASPRRFKLPLLRCRFDVVQLRLRGLPRIRQPHLVCPAPLLEGLQHDS